MNLNSKQAQKENIKRQKIDRMRALRVVKYIEYPFILPDSPVVIEEGFIVSDRDTYDVFASFIFKNITEHPIRKLNIRIDCYLNQNIPYTHIDFTYSQEDLTFGIIGKDGIDLKLRESNQRTYIKKSETFGSCVYIPLPESYFTKMEVILVSVEYAGGQINELNTIVVGASKKYNELDSFSKIVYSRVNIYKAAEEKFPTKVIPQFGNTVWLCCCGNKNPITSDKCEKCGREQEWQKNSVTAELLEEKKNNLINDPREIRFHDKGKFKQNKHLETKEEIQQKIDQYEKAMKNIAYEEKRKERRRLMIIPKVLIAIGILYLLVFVLKLILEFRIPSEGSADGNVAVDTAAIVNADDIFLNNLF